MSKLGRVNKKDDITGDALKTRRLLVSVDTPSTTRLHYPLQPISLPLCYPPHDQMSSSTSATNTQKSTLVQRELAKAQNLVKDDATAIGTISLDAVQSGAYLYPLYVPSRCSTSSGAELI